jgi:hypothetical protein
MNLCCLVKLPSGVWLDTGLLLAHRARDGVFVGVVEGGEGKVEQPGGVEAAVVFYLTDEDGLDSGLFGKVEQLFLVRAGFYGER